MSTLLRGKQIRLATLQRAHIDAAFESALAAIESNITSITDVMSTDQERIDAIAAVTAAWAAADGNLQATLTSLVTATKTGAGLQADGTYVLPVGQSYLTGSTSMALAIAALDAALKAEADAHDADIASIQAELLGLAGSTATDMAAAILVETDRAESEEARIEGLVTAEVSRASGVEAGLQLGLDNEITARTNLNITLQTAITAANQARTDGDAAEFTRATAEETRLQGALDNEALARTTADGEHTAAISTEVSDRAAAVLAEATARIDADEALDGRIDVLEAATPNSLTYAKYVCGEDVAGVKNDVNKVFTLAYTPAAGTLMLFVGGMFMTEGITADYTITGSEITLTEAPDALTFVKATYFR
jgi:hypothetical protein